ncbi:DUF4097 family beta strand repeat-containing protein [Streptomyces sp. AA1529]|uniref:DUF4097 family beta strand repeat-containing protein n=1 Tax=Streptomyces sp. AA1529 TaxID=1203257 RepID=UPI003D755559
MAIAHYRPRTLFTFGGASLTLTLLALAALTHFNVSADDAEPQKRSFAPVSDQLTVAKNNGELDIRPADVTQIEVTRQFASRSLPGGRPEATWDLTDERLTLATDCGPLSLCDVRYEILVPKDVALTVEGDSGQVTATGFGMALKIRTDSGAIRVDNASGRLTLDTENGELRATRLTSNQVDVGSESGDVHLSFASIPEQVRTATENGALSIGLPNAAYKVITTTDSGDVRTDLPEDPNSSHTIRASTENGAITLRATE